MKSKTKFEIIPKSPFYNVMELDELRLFNQSNVIKGLGFSKDGLHGVISFSV